MRWMSLPTLALLFYVWMYAGKLKSEIGTYILLLLLLLLCILALRESTRYIVPYKLMSCHLHGGPGVCPVTTPQFKVSKVQRLFNRRVWLV